MPHPMGQRHLSPKPETHHALRTGGLRNPSPITEGIISSLWLFITSFYAFALWLATKPSSSQSLVQQNPEASGSLAAVSYPKLPTWITLYVVCPGRFALHTLCSRRDPVLFTSLLHPTSWSPATQGSLVLSGVLEDSLHHNLSSGRLLPAPSVHSRTFFPNGGSTLPLSTLPHIKTSHRQKCPPNSGAGLLNP